MLFPRVTFCHGEGRAYNHSSLEQLGYKDVPAFVSGRRSGPGQGNGWVTERRTAEEVFEAAYSQPQLETFLRNDSYLKLNGSRSSRGLGWLVSPMSYEGGRLELQTKVLTKVRNHGEDPFF